MPKPYKKKYTKRPRKAYGKRRGLPTPTRTNGGLMSLCRTTVLPDRLIVRLPYTANVTKTIAANDGGNCQVWNLNSIYDPDRTGAGHQPLGRDSFYKLYAKYRVISCSYFIQITNITGAPIQFGLTKGPFAIGSFSLAPGQALMEQPHTQRKTLNALPGTGSMIQFTGKCHVPTVIGKSSVQYKSDPNTGAYQSSNPAQLACLNLMWLPMNAAQQSFTINVRLQYTVEYFERVALPLSNTKPDGDGPSTTMDMSQWTSS